MPRVVVSGSSATRCTSYGSTVVAVKPQRGSASPAARERYPWWNLHYRGLPMDRYPLRDSPQSSSLAIPGTGASSGCGRFCAHAEFYRRQACRLGSMNGGARVGDSSKLAKWMHIIISSNRHRTRSQSDGIASTICVSVSRMHYCNRYSRNRHHFLDGCIPALFIALQLWCQELKLDRATGARVERVPRVRVAALEARPLVHVGQEHAVRMRCISTTQPSCLCKVPLMRSSLEAARTKTLHRLL
jgi:hypothetical protein